MEIVAHSDAKRTLLVGLLLALAVICALVVVVEHRTGGGAPTAGAGRSALVESHKKANCTPSLYLPSYTPKKFVSGEHDALVYVAGYLELFEPYYTRYLPLDFQTLEHEIRADNSGTISLAGQCVSLDLHYDYKLEVQDNDTLDGIGTTWNTIYKHGQCAVDVLVASGASQEQRKLCSLASSFGSLGPNVTYACWQTRNYLCKRRALASYYNQTKANLVLTGFQVELRAASITEPASSSTEFSYPTLVCY